MLSRIAKFSAVGSVGALIAAVILSERAHKKERVDRPVKPGVHYLAHEVTPSQSGSAHTLVFLHGWPDDLSLFRPFVRELSKFYNCVNCNLPGYPLPPTFNGDPGTLPCRKWGYTFEETITAIKNTIDKTCAGASSVTLVTHDWGSLMGYMFHRQYPDRVIHRMIALDIGWRVKGFTRKGLAGVLTYQGLLNLFFLLPTSIGSFLTYQESKYLQRIPAEGCGPVTNVMNWPYRAAFRDLFTGGPLTLVRRYRPQEIPILFMHGDWLHDSLAIYDKGWVNAIEKSMPGVSKSVEIEGHHWFLQTNPHKVMQIMLDFLKETDAKIKIN